MTVKSAAFGLSLALGLPAVQPGLAAPVPWLYEVDQVVQEHTAADRRAASGGALLEMLSRISGLAEVPRTPQVRAALNQPEAYYNRFLFLEGGKIRIFFAPTAILNLVNRARLPIWSADRPKTLAWLVLESADGRQLLDAEHALARALVAGARARGLVLHLPLLDLMDQAQVHAAAVWGRFPDVLRSASQRYAADILLLGRLQLRDDGACAASFEAWLGRETVAAETECLGLEQAGRWAADFLAGELAGRFAVPSRETESFALTLLGVDSPSQYGQLLAHLDALEFVQAVQVTALAEGRLEIAVQTRAEFEQLLKLLAKDGRLSEAPPNAPSNALLWQGR